MAACKRGRSLPLTICLLSAAVAAPRLERSSPAPAKAREAGAEDGSRRPNKKKAHP